MLEISHLGGADPEKNMKNLYFKGHFAWNLGKKVKNHLGFILLTRSVNSATLAFFKRNNAYGESFRLKQMTGKYILIKILKHN